MAIRAMVEASLGPTGEAFHNSGTLSMYDCIIAGNSSGGGVDGASGGSGGGVFNAGKCQLYRCLVSGNSGGAGGGPAGNPSGSGGSGGNGGGIFNSGTMVLNRCIISGNVGGPGASGGDPSGWITIWAPGGGGGYGGSGAGIYNVGQMELSFSSVYANSSGSGGNGGSFGTGGSAGNGGCGAAILNGGKLSLNTCTISGNLCGNGGSGGGEFTGNCANGGAGGSGGGVYNLGLLNLTSCTIALNETGVGGNGGNGQPRFDPTPPAAGGEGGSGGGIWSDTSATVVVRNTLVAMNLVSDGGLGGTNTYYPRSPRQQITMQIGTAGLAGAAPDLGGDYTSHGYNLVGMADGSTGLTNRLNADQVGSSASLIDPFLGPLQMNGGPTPTHALLPGSPAIDQGNCFGVHQDQRGQHRPCDDGSVPNAPGGDGSDIGAFELYPTKAVAAP